MLVEGYSSSFGFDLLKLENPMKRQFILETKKKPSGNHNNHKTHYYNKSSNDENISDSSVRVGNSYQCSELPKLQDITEQTLEAFSSPILFSPEFIKSEDLDSYFQVVLNNDINNHDYVVTETEIDLALSALNESNYELEPAIIHYQKLLHEIPNNEWSTQEIQKIE